MARIKKINIEKFYDKYIEEYEAIYKAEEDGKYMAGYDEAVNAFDEFIKKESQRKFVMEFNNYIRDYISSDREAAAFMFALNDLENENEEVVS